MDPVDHRSVYLLVFRSPVFPAHWALWIPRQDNAKIGKIISAVGDPATGFVHEFQRNFCPSGPNSMLPVNKIDPKYVADGEASLDQESTIDTNATDELESVALSVPPPEKSLNSVAESGVRRRVAIKNCQTWMRDYVLKLVERGVLDQAAVEIVDSAPKN
ncbi:hypothetical protein RhiJN_05609 [Ceratobasidium sp. AG-Ba]|nr:hypothetical protein RhiJN_05609 [Ceratobasidium sp. AG-Ba]QRW06538.1 hypothetical protein RhiLY_05537 [Ceratobasidium sp. AG-Ba]